MRRWVLGAVIALGIALGTIIASHAALWHVYGAAQREIYMQVDNQVGRVILTSWEEAEDSNIPILIYKDNGVVDAGSIVDWEQTYWLGGVQAQNFENVVLDNSLVLSPTNEAEPFTTGKFLDAKPSTSMVYGVIASTASTAPTDSSPGEYVPAAESAGAYAPSSPTITSWSVNMENGASGSFILSKTNPPDPLPLAAGLGIAAGLVVFAAWIGYRRAWGDATSTLLKHGLHDMTVRDVEIVGFIMERGKFTIPELMKQTRASKITVWRTVQKLVEQGLVRQTEQTKLAANGIGGRGKPSHVYEYVGEKGVKP